MESAKKILEKMLSAGFWPDTVSLNTLVNFLCKSGHVYLAADLFTKMKVVGFEPDEITYGMLVDGLCLAGRPDDAYRLLENELEYYDFPVPINSTPNEMNRAVISIAQDGENKKLSKKPVLNYSALKRLYERIQNEYKENEQLEKMFGIQAF